MEDWEAEVGGSSILGKIIAEQDLGVVTVVEECEEAASNHKEDHKELECTLEALSLGARRASLAIGTVSLEPASAALLGANGKFLLRLVDLVGR